MLIGRSTLLHSNTHSAANIRQSSADQSNGWSKIKQPNTGDNLRNLHSFSSSAQQERIKVVDFVPSLQLPPMPVNINNALGLYQRMSAMETASSGNSHAMRPGDATTLGTQLVESETKKENGKTSGTISVTYEDGSKKVKDWDDKGYTTTTYDSNNNVVGVTNYTYEARINEPQGNNSSSQPHWGGLVYTNPGWRTVPDNQLSTRVNLLA